MPFDTLIKKNAKIEDTLENIVKEVNDPGTMAFAHDVAKALEHGQDKLTFLHDAYDYVTRNVNYILDRDEWRLQNGKYVKVPIEEIWTSYKTVSEGVGDCKKMTVLLASILNAAGIEPVLKHVYFKDEPTYTHIYLIVDKAEVGEGGKSFPAKGSYYTLDATMKPPVFNKEVSYDEGKLHFLNGKTMELRRVGFNSNFSEDISGGAQLLIDDMEHIGAAPSASHAGIMHNLIPNKPALQKALAHIPIEQQRGSFLALIRANHGGIANQLAIVLGTKPTALDDVWVKQMGGDIAELKKAVAEGAKVAATPVVVSGVELVGSFFSKLLHGAAAILHVVANVAAVVVPSLAPAINNIANKADQIANAAGPATPPPGATVAPPPPPAQMPIDNTGRKMPQPGMSHGSFFSLGGFIFKSLMLLMMWQRTYNLNSQLASVLGFVAVVAPLMYVAVIKIKKHYGKIHRTS